jgi:hypothetical protein
MSQPVLDSWFEDLGPGPITSGTATNKGGPGNGTIQSVADRVLIVWVGSSGTATITSITWAGNALTQIGSSVATAGARTIYMYGLKGDSSVTTGSQSLAVNISAGTVTAISAYVFNGCDTAIGWANNISNTGNSTSAGSGAITSTANDYCVMGTIDDNADGSGFAGSSGTTADNREGRADGNYCIGREAGIAGSLDITIGSSAQGWATLAVALIGSTANPGDFNNLKNFKGVRPHAFRPGLAR